MIPCWNGSRERRCGPFLTSLMPRMPTTSCGRSVGAYEGLIPQAASTRSIHSRDFSLSPRVVTALVKVKSRHKTTLTSAHQHDTIVFHPRQGRYAGLQLCAILRRRDDKDVKCSP